MSRSRDGSNHERDGEKKQRERERKEKREMLLKFIDRVKIEILFSRYSLKFSNKYKER